MSAPYRKIRSTGGWWVLVILSSIVISLLITSTLPRNGEVWKFLLAFTPMFVALAGCIYFEHRFQQKRMGKVREAFSAQGYEVVERADLEWLGQFAFMDQWAGLLNRGYVCWAAKTAEVLVLEHEYTTGSGKTTMTHPRTFLVWLRGVPALDGAWFYRPAFGERRRMEKSHRIHVTGDEVFDKKWLLTNVPDGAFLSEESRNLMRETMPTESWAIGSRSVVLQVKAHLDEEGVMKFVEYGNRVMNSLSS